MPTSYQPPMPKKQADKRTHSQSQTTNMQGGAGTVRKVLAGRDGSVFSIGPDDTLGQAVEILRDKHIGALVVTDASGALCGILSERDIVRKLADAPGKTLPHKVSEVMTADVKTCGPDETLVAVLQTMSAGRFRHLPVTEGDKLVGMITIGDVVNHRLNELEHEALQLKQLIVG